VDDVGEHVARRKLGLRLRGHSGQVVRFFALCPRSQPCRPGSRDRVLASLQLGIDEIACHIGDIRISGMVGEYEAGPQIRDRPLTARLSPKDRHFSCSSSRRGQYRPYASGVRAGGGAGARALGYHDGGPNAPLGLYFQIKRGTARECASEFRRRRSIPRLRNPCHLQSPRRPGRCHLQSPPPWRPASRVISGSRRYASSKTLCRSIRWITMYGYLKRARSDGPVGNARNLFARERINHQNG